MGAIRGYYRENSQLLYATILDTFTKPFLNGSRNEWSDEIERISDTGSHSARICFSREDDHMSTQEKVTVHKLQNRWTIYEQIQFHNEKDKKKGFLNSFENICSFSTAEGFWLNWNRIPTVTCEMVVFVNYVVSCFMTVKTESSSVWMSVIPRILL